MILTYDKRVSSMVKIRIRNYYVLNLVNGEEGV